VAAAGGSGGSAALRMRTCIHTYTYHWACVCVQVARLHCGITSGATRGRRGDTCSVSYQDLQLEVP
jgi:hypothetical protein